jgi:hypothetical protein
VAQLAAHCRLIWMLIKQGILFTATGEKTKTEGEKYFLKG